MSRSFSKDISYPDHFVITLELVPGSEDRGLALTGDYSGKGFRGQGTPVFDIDSCGLICFLKMLEYRTRQEKEASQNFFTGCAVSPFKQTAAETFAQYFKVCKKVGAGAEFAKFKDGVFR
jgi:5,10-methylenetetrahydrofolate reductase